MVLYLMPVLYTFFPAPGNLRIDYPNKVNS
jgi:hypothetical protein